MIRWLLATRTGRALSAAVVAVLAFVGIIAHQRRDAAKDARKDIEHEYERETSRRVEAGRAALRDGGGSSPDVRVSRSDDKWK